MEFKILDELLKYLLTSDCYSYVQIRNDTIIKSEFLKTVENFKFEAALEKLVKDEYVTKKTQDIIYYAISFEGICFIKNGGYHQALLETHRKENAYSDLQTEQKKQAISLLRLNRWLVFGAIVVAIDSTLNILHFFGVYFDVNNFLFCIKPN
jgi:hypothetical protein